MTYLHADSVENEDENAMQYPVELHNWIDANTHFRINSWILERVFLLSLLATSIPTVSLRRTWVQTYCSYILLSNEILETLLSDTNDMSAPGEGFNSFRLTYPQVPIKKSLTIYANRPHGQAHGGSIVIDLRHEPFSHGQEYFALSTTTHISIFNIPSETERVVKRVGYQVILYLNRLFG